MLVRLMTAPQVYDKENDCYFDKARIKGTMDDMEYINYASYICTVKAGWKVCIYAGMEAFGTC